MPARSKSPRSSRRASWAQRALMLGVAMGAIALIALTTRQRTAEGASVTTMEAAVIAGVASVIDGDTIEVHGERIRLDAIDAPESGQKCLDRVGGFYRCGSEAANALDTLLNGNPVTCRPMGKDRYKRTLAQCSVRGENINAWMVRSGHALAYRQYSTALVPEEEAARADSLGVWAGRVIEPWKWRKGARLPGEAPTKAMQEGRIEASEGLAPN